MGREFLHLTPVDEALALFRSHFPEPLDTRVDVPLADALGLVLAADVHAAEDLPGWPRATVDGYAVQAKSVRGAAATRPTYLKLLGEVAMGHPAGLSVGPGECARIATGGMLPAGADAVVMVEHTDLLDPATVEVAHGPSEWEGVNRPGEDFRANALLVPAGTRLRPAEIAVLAAAGRTTLPCRHPLTAALISTGDELVPADRAPGPGQVRDVNTPALAAALRQAGLVPHVAGLFPDDPPLLAAALADAVAQHDVVLISGGSSVGRADHTYDLLHALGDPGVFVHGLAIRPGKPTLLAKAHGKPLFGLPGHPASSLVIFAAVIAPCLAHLAGELPRPRTVWARAGRPVRSGPGKDEYLKVRLVPDGLHWRAEPLFGQSGNVLALAQADGLLRVPLESDGLAEGDPAEVLLL